MHTASYNEARGISRMSPDQTLSMRVGSGFNHVNCRSCIFPLRTSYTFFPLVYIFSHRQPGWLNNHTVGQNLSRRITLTVSVLNNWLLIVACSNYTCININAAIRTSEPCPPADISTTPILTFNIVPWVGEFSTLMAATTTKSNFAA